MHTRADSSAFCPSLQGVHNSDFAPLQCNNKMQQPTTALHRQRKTEPRSIAMKGHPCALSQFTHTHTHTHTHTQTHTYTHGQQGRKHTACISLAGTSTQRVCNQRTALHTYARHKCHILNIASVLHWAYATQSGLRLRMHTQTKRREWRYIKVQKDQPYDTLNTRTHTRTHSTRESVLCLGEVSATTFDPALARDYMTHTRAHTNGHNDMTREMTIALTWDDGEEGGDAPCFTTNVRTKQQYNVTSVDTRTKSSTLGI